MITYFGMAEPKTKKSEKRQRTEFIRARVTPEEKANFLQHCAAAGLSMGDFIRKKYCNTKPLRMYISRREHQVVMAQVLGQLMKSQNRMARLDNNVNQMAKAINSARLSINNSELVLIIDRNEKVLHQLQILYTEYIRVSTECRDEIRQIRKG